MAVLRAVDDSRTIPLPALCTIGRARACDLVLADKSVSGQHAAIEWSGSEWEVRDLGSSNGTYLEGKKLVSGARTAVAAGMRLRFGQGGPLFTVVEAAAPQLMARDLASGEHRIADGGYLVLPEANSPECSIYQDMQGAWIVERRGETGTIDDRAVVATAGDRLWRVHLPTSWSGTFKDSEQQAVLLLAHLRLCFRFTRDEEHVELCAWAGERRMDLQARAHHYLLLVLARARLVDVGAGVAEPEQGWVRQDELVKMLRMDDNHLNISIHRARTQLGQVGVVDAAGLVQRRSGTRQLRIGVARLELAAFAG